MKISEKQLIALISIVEATVTDNHLRQFFIGRMSMVDRVALLNTIRNQSNDQPVDIGHAPTEI